ncbi:hypothetical protein EJ08DRAFT_693508 [Tothia fuscella]|uniref:Uncharacterized protein n=1 Tax=Tothia fuscella TaxID=1048955 RepID=A0A9P4NZE9_9PEZI|nr:hypothetical protein EJ08DRAFT_693508 [Tothia fuscella]
MSSVHPVSLLQVPTKAPGSVMAARAPPLITYATILKQGLRDKQIENQIPGEEQPKPLPKLENAATNPSWAKPQKDSNGFVITSYDDWTARARAQFRHQIRQEQKNRISPELEAAFDPIPRHAPGTCGRFHCQCFPSRVNDFSRVPNRDIVVRIDGPARLILNPVDNLVEVQAQTIKSAVTIDRSKETWQKAWKVCYEETCVFEIDISKYMGRERRVWSTAPVTEAIVMGMRMVHVRLVNKVRQNYKLISNNASRPGMYEAELPFLVNPMHTHLDEERLARMDDDFERRVQPDLESVKDAVDEEPWPRYWQTIGTQMAIRTRIYHAAQKAAFDQPYKGHISNDVVVQLLHLMVKWEEKESFGFENTFKSYLNQYRQWRKDNANGKANETYLLNHDAAYIQYGREEGRKMAAAMVRWIDDAEGFRDGFSGNWMGEDGLDEFGV